MIIAVDGPAASGKGTISRRVAAERSLAYLDTGRLYRVTGYLVLASGADPDDEGAAVGAAENAVTAQLPDDALRTDQVADAASRVAAIPAVRAALIGVQRGFATHPPGVFSGAILDGRDIGSVICPQADVKLFVTASPEIRAERRYKELKTRGTNVRFEDVLQDIKARDKRDAGRTAAPLTKAPDAYLLDTTHLTADEAVAAANALIEKALSAFQS